MKAHDFSLDEKYNTVLVTVTNPFFPIIPDMTLEERQHLAKEDGLSTVELPLILLDNCATADKIKEWNRTKQTPFTELAVQRDDVRVTVSTVLSTISSEIHTSMFFRPRHRTIAKKRPCW